ncbi:hypothetical protein EJ06DRAFT_527267 [Trichodelitschia bisporula]|uniref:Uncharacterized protein n=1 Tax=Trichodelitschia bisporula TaxID=703511 RepID=A0A6G1I5X3_9PEZI|nr:hypothetical protein EJ06DRAFT_527267 [Trichodelitschia bisporula]
MPALPSEELVELVASCEQTLEVIRCALQYEGKKPYDTVPETQEVVTLLSDFMAGLKDSQAPTEKLCTPRLNMCIERAEDLHTHTVDLTKRRSCTNHERERWHTNLFGLWWHLRQLEKRPLG